MGSFYLRYESSRMLLRQTNFVCIKALAGLKCVATRHIGVFVSIACIVNRYNPYDRFLWCDDKAL